MSMDDLPPPLLLEILNRISDSTDLARCRLASKTLKSLSYEVRSLTLICSFDRYLRSRSPDSKTLTTPFKSIVKKNLLYLSKTLESVSVSIEKPFCDSFEYDDGEDEYDDLHLTSVDFVSQWLPEVGERLRSLSISDFWIQSCWRKSEVLALISACCDNSLLNLELKNAWLSVEGLKLMPMLTSLTLEFIRLDDEDLNKVNECFPSLQILNLIGVGGFREPKIHLLQLKTCHWTVSNAPLCLAIHAPKLIDLTLKCVKPKVLVLKAPLLSVLDLSIEKPSYDIDVDRFLNLKSLRIESSDPRTLVRLFPDGRTVEKLVLEAPKQADLFELREMVDFESLMSTFPNVVTVVMGPWIYVELEKSFECEDPAVRFGWKRLKKLTVYLVLSELEVTCSFISFVFDRCSALSDVAMLIHSDVIDDIKNRLISKCLCDWPRVGWRWECGKKDRKIRGFATVSNPALLSAISIDKESRG
ncbi:LOW QUALITY PROTEIN: F-box/LRR-repeat protein At4g29420 [Magnolia sinica]|uniref:LOW QUALITY PROTEIN: F-box/LRR-repeat protein At4g29420 n=1 Tax=Magnolia sinica TaxID=86752 RepID=UPI00265830AD|nr:LOW QUALITY PROTEIN: F-box/LRR-repeat protein At4g29420 [Magnolia sinica]